MTTLVFAGDYRQYYDWCRQEGVRPSGGEHRYVSGWHSVRGLGQPDTKVKRIGTWYENRDVLQYMQYLEQCGVDVYA